MSARVPAANVKLKRAYEPPSPEDGTRILVDRLWPRGVSRERARLDDWLKDVAPSTPLRRWYASTADAPRRSSCRNAFSVAGSSASAVPCAAVAW